MSVGQDPRPRNARVISHTRDNDDDARPPRERGALAAGALSADAAAAAARSLDRGRRADAGTGRGAPVRRDVVGRARRGRCSRRHGDRGPRVPPSPRRGASRDTRICMYIIIIIIIILSTLVCCMYIYTRIYHVCVSLCVIRTRCYYCDRYYRVPPRAARVCTSYRARAACARAPYACVPNTRVCAYARTAVRCLACDVRARAPGVRDDRANNNNNVYV